MQDELLDIYDVSQRWVGQERRAVVHRKGYWHRAVNIFVLNPSEQLLIQRRAHAKNVYPNTWDLSVAEHLKAGESYIEAAHRGLAEEMGIGSVVLHQVGKISASKVELSEQNIKDYEFQLCFSTLYKGEIRINTNEVAEARYVPLAEVHADQAAHPAHYTPWFRNCLNVFLVQRCS